MELTTAAFQLAATTFGRKCEPMPGQPRTGDDRKAMSRPLIISIPQKLGRQEARRRLDSGISRLKPELGVVLSGLNYHWESDTLHFIGTAMWQRITGRIEVLEDTVRVEIDLPWMMQVLRDTITRRVRGRGIELLEKPPGEA